MNEEVERFGVITTAPDAAVCRAHENMVALDDGEPK